VAAVGRAVLAGEAVLPRLRAGEDGLAVHPWLADSFVAVLEMGATSWTQILDTVRLGPADDATAVTAEQLRGVVERLIGAGQWAPGEPDIVIVTDAGYDVARLAWCSASGSAARWARHPERSPPSSTPSRSRQPRPLTKDSRGYDAGKRINGRKRHLVVDTKGLPLFVMVTPADMTDRNAAKEVLFRLRLMHPEITIVRADSAYAGQLVTWTKTYLNLTIKTVSRPKDASGFIVLPRRWVVERSQCATRRSVCIPGSAGRNSEGGSWAE
jgi:transposase